MLLTGIFQTKIIDKTCYFLGKGSGVESSETSRAERAEGEGTTVRHQEAGRGKQTRAETS
jgi:hypothetical protein